LQGAAEAGSNRSINKPFLKGSFGPPMAARKPKVVVTRKLPAHIEARMGELFDVRLNPDDAPMSPAALAEAMAEAEVLVPTITDRIDARIIAAAGPDLKMIA